MEAIFSKAGTDTPGGLRMLCVAFFLFSFSAEEGPPLARAASNITAALVSVLICYVLVTLIRDKDSGHTTLHCVELAYFVNRAIVHTWITHNAFHGGRPIPLLMSNVSTFSEVVFGLYFFSTRRDLAATFKRSELQRKVIEDKIDHVRSIANLVSYEGELRRNRKSKVKGQPSHHVDSGE